jgi:hypothetical protein
MFDDTRKAWWDRVTQRCVSLSFVALLALPLLDFRFGFDKTPPPVENRALATAPNWPTTAGEWRALPSALTAYWSDNFGMRKLLVRAHARLRYALGDSPVPNVVLGDKHWAFYVGDEAVAQFRGLHTLSAPELAAWTRALTARKNWVEANGGHYFFVLAPNKESIYPELYPSKFSRVGPSLADGLIAHLRSHSDVNIIDLRPALQAAKGSGQLYFATDTHWNDRGAYVAYAAIMTELKRILPDLQVRARDSFRPQAAPPFCGDLSAMMGLQTLTEPMTVFVPTPPLYAKPIDAGYYRPYGTARYEILQTPERSRTAVVFHDSLFLAPEDRDPRRTDPCFVRTSPLKLSQVFSDSFSRTVLSWHLGGGFSQELLQRERPSVVVQEVIERHLLYGPQGDIPAL